MDYGSFCCLVIDFFSGHYLRDRNKDGLEFLKFSGLEYREERHGGGMGAGNLMERR